MILTTVDHNNQTFFHLFDIGNGIHIYTNPDSDSPYDEVNGILIQYDDIFYNVDNKRPASEDELNETLRSLKTAKIPNSVVSSAMVRVLSGIKPKRVSKAKIVTVEVKTEIDVEENDYDEEVDDDEEGDDEEA